jgi:hypothetical protein
VEEMNATYELLPRNEFTYEMSRPEAVPGSLYRGMNMSRSSRSTRRRTLSRSLTRRTQTRTRRSVWRKRDSCLSGRRRSRRTRVQRSSQPPGKPAEVAEDGRVIAQKRAEEKRAAEELSRMSEERNQAEMKRTAIEAGREQEDRAQTELAAVKSRQTQQPAQIQPPAPPNVTSERPIDVDERQFSPTNPQPSANRQRLLSASMDLLMSETQLAVSSLRSRTRSFRARRCELS